MLTASIVLYNTPVKTLMQAVESFSPSSENILFLIDNSDIPEVSSRYSELISSLWETDVVYLKNKKNIGYGRAHNIALRMAIKMHSSYHIILNPDVNFKTSILGPITDYMDSHKDVIYLLPKVLYPDGRLQYLCKLLPTPRDLLRRRITGKENDHYTLKFSGYDKVMNPPCLSGCFMFLRLTSVEEYNLFFDERFFIYFEDFDLIRRCHRHGKTIYFPFVEIIHGHQRQSYNSLWGLLNHAKSAIQYFHKYGWFVDEERVDMNKRILDDLR